MIKTTKIYLILFKIQTILFIHTIINTLNHYKWNFLLITSKHKIIYKPTFIFNNPLFKYFLKISLWFFYLWMRLFSKPHLKLRTHRVQTLPNPQKRSFLCWWERKSLKNSAVIRLNSIFFVLRTHPTPPPKIFPEK